MSNKQVKVHHIQGDKITGHKFSAPRKICQLATLDESSPSYPARLTTFNTPVRRFRHLQSLPRVVFPACLLDRFMIHRSVSRHRAQLDRRLHRLKLPFLFVYPPEFEEGLLLL
jgi:hypothetical protein